MKHQFKLWDSVIVQPGNHKSLIVEIKGTNVKVVYYDKEGKKHYNNCESDALESYHSTDSDNPKM